MDLYSYVGDDPVNHTDPTGLSCERNTDGTAKSCTLEGGDKLGAAKGKFENQMKNLANKLTSKAFRDRTVSYKGPNGQMIKTTYGAVGRAIMDRPAKYDPNQVGADNKGGEKAGYSKGLQESVMTFGPGAIAGKGINNGGSPERITNTIIGHEGLHGSSQETNSWNSATQSQKDEYQPNGHQSDFNSAGQAMYDAK